MIIPRYHCDDEMDYMGKTKDGFAYVCRKCDAVEYAFDPTAPTTPLEVARKDPTHYGSETKIGY